MVDHGLQPWCLIQKRRGQPWWITITMVNQGLEPKFTIIVNGRTWSGTMIQKKTWSTMPWFQTDELPG